MISWIRAKSSPCQGFPLASKTWRTANDTLPVILLDDPLAVSKAKGNFCAWSFAHFKMPCPETHRKQSHACNHGWMSSCIIHELENILGRGSVVLNTPQIYTTLKPACLTAISRLQQAFGRSRSYRQRSCFRVGAWIHLNSLDNFGF